MKNIPHRIILSEDQLPKQWYNLRADMKEQPDSMLNPATGKPVAEEELSLYSAGNWPIRRWTDPHGMWIPRRRSWNFTKCTVPPR